MRSTFTHQSFPVRIIHATLAVVVMAGAIACGPTGQAGDANLESVAADDVLAFSIEEGRMLNEFYRAGPVAAHLALTSGRAPRLVVAFPAGNSGAGLWFEESDAEATWRVVSLLRGAAQTDDHGQTLYGIEAEATLTGPALTVKRALVGNVRSLRNYADRGEIAQGVEVAPELSARRVTWRRTRLDDAPGYHLSVEALEGTIRRTDGRIRLIPSGDGRLRLRIVALTGETPLTPIPTDRLLKTESSDARSLQVLAFLSYREKLLAGSWRFLTYFGRDTLLSLKMLAPAAAPQLMEAGLSAVLERLNAHGEVAHEEDVAEYAILRRRAAGEPPSPEPIFDYAMIDDDFLLAPVAADYLLQRPAQSARAFLERRTTGGESYGAALLRNLTFVVEAARPFAAVPERANLIHLKPGRYAGDWRDSKEGLGGGRAPYGVNAVLVPAALEAAARLHASGLLAAYLDEAAGTALAEAGAMAAVWSDHAAGFFRVRIDNAAAREQVAAYAAAVSAPEEPALAALGADDVVFNALALDGDGAPIPVLHSDESFLLAFREPSPEALTRALEAIMRPFPAGLMTPAGLLVANAAYAPAAMQRDFSNAHYHGAVVWSWQQALLAAGLDRQLRRKDLDEGLRAKLEAARRALWAAIKAGETVKTSELWSWSVRDGAFVIEPFGQREGDATESNAAQLWSAVYLGVRRPVSE
ncbi:hypothetical protein [Amphiplicatus metriothermophilus]|nr:hypothetical protein [Amphiplicatus metriothermophilus]MBB5518436.1 hypothetical protein [Amphiplicatus metriothermophilus]